jgi:hypothetical protein
MVGMSGEYQRGLAESLTLERREVPEAYGAVFACRGEPTTRRRKGEGQNGIVMSTQQGHNLATRVVVEADGIALA